VVKPQKTIESIKNAIWRQSHDYTIASGTHIIRVDTYDSVRNKSTQTVRIPIIE